MRNPGGVLGTVKFGFLCMHVRACVHAHVCVCACCSATHPRLMYCGMPPDSATRRAILASLSQRLQLAGDVDLSWLADEQQTAGFTGADLAALLSEAQLAAVHEVLDAQTAAPAGAAAVGQQQHKAGAATGAGSGATAGVVSAVPSAAAPSSSEAGAAIPAATAGAVDAATERECVRTAPHTAPLITHGHLVRVLAAARPSLPAQELRRLEAIYARFQSGRRAATTATTTASFEVQASHVPTSVDADLPTFEAAPPMPPHSDGAITNGHGASAPHRHDDASDAAAWTTASIPADAKGKKKVTLA